jgi:hypothetical protein
MVDSTDLEEEFVEVSSIRRISLAGITPELARGSGFRGVVDLLKVAKHGSGEKCVFDRFQNPMRNGRGSKPESAEASLSEGQFSADSV